MPSRYSRRRMACRKEHRGGARGSKEKGEFVPFGGRGGLLL
jgi:hypothetical protein